MERKKIVFSGVHEGYNTQKLPEAQIRKIWGR